MRAVPSISATPKDNTAKDVNKMQVGEVVVMDNSIKRVKVGTLWDNKVDLDSGVAMYTRSREGENGDNCFCYYEQNNNPLRHRNGEMMNDLVVFSYDNQIGRQPGRDGAARRAPLTSPPGCQGDTTPESIIVDLENLHDDIAYIVVYIINYDGGKIADIKGLDCGITDITDGKNERVASFGTDDLEYKDKQGLVLATFKAIVDANDPQKKRIAWKFVKEGGEKSAGDGKNPKAQEDTLKKHITDELTIAKVPST